MPLLRLKHQISAPDPELKNKKQKYRYGCGANSVLVAVSLRLTAHSVPAAICESPGSGEKNDNIDINFMEKSLLINHICGEGLAPSCN
jgi:hypothetical protein